MATKRERERRERARSKKQQPKSEVEPQPEETGGGKTEGEPTNAEQPQPDPVIPYRIQLNFQGATREHDAGDLVAIMEVVTDEAEKRGLYPDWNVITEMDTADIVVGSDLDRQVSGSEHG